MWGPVARGVKGRYYKYKFSIVQNSTRIALSNFPICKTHKKKVVIYVSERCGKWIQFSIRDFCLTVTIWSHFVHHFGIINGFNAVTNGYTINKIMFVNCLKKVLPKKWIQFYPHYFLSIFHSFVRLSLECVCICWSMTLYCPIVSHLVHKVLI